MTKTNRAFLNEELCSLHVAGHVLTQTLPLLLIQDLGVEAAHLKSIEPPSQCVMHTHTHMHHQRMSQYTLLAQARALIHTHTHTHTHSYTHTHTANLLSRS